MGRKHKYQQTVTLHISLNVRAEKIAHLESLSSLPCTQSMLEARPRGTGYVFPYLCFFLSKIQSEVVKLQKQQQQK